MNTKALLVIFVSALGLAGCAAKQEAPAPETPTQAPAAVAPATEESPNGGAAAEGAAAPAPPPAEKKTQDAKQKGGIIIND